MSDPPAPSRPPSPEAAPPYPSDPHGAQNAGESWHVRGLEERAPDADTTDMNPTSPFHRIHTVHRVLAADGTVLNWGWSNHEAAQDDADRRGSGAHVVVHQWEAEVPASDRVLIESGIPEAEWGVLRLAANRAMNMTMDAGRPSDAMRSAVRAHRLAN